MPCDPSVRSHVGWARPPSRRMARRLCPSPLSRIASSDRVPNTFRHPRPCRSVLGFARPGTPYRMHAAHRVPPWLFRRSTPRDAGRLRGRHLHRDERAGSDEGTGTGSLVLVVHTATTTRHCLATGCLSTQPITEPCAHHHMPSSHLTLMTRITSCYTSMLHTTLTKPAGIHPSPLHIACTTRSGRKAATSRNISGFVVIFFI